MTETYTKIKLFWIILLMGVLALAGSFFLSVDALLLAKNPDLLLGCDFSSKVSCSVVGQSWQAEVFGFPNSFLGMMFEPVIIFVSVLFLSGSRMKKWLVWAVQGLLFVSLGMAIWLFIQSAFVIQVLCPWCLVVCFSTIIMTFVFFHFSNANGFFGKALTKFSQAYGEYAVMLLLIVFVGATISVKYLL